MIKLRCVFEMGFAHSAYHDDVRQFDVDIIAFDHNQQGTVGRVIGTALLSMTAALEPATPPIVAPPFCELMLTDFDFYEAYQAFVNADATVKADLGIHHPVESLIHVQHVELVADLCEYRACILNTIGTLLRQ
jgi:hypothetical protein